MKMSVQARLDEESEAALERIVRRRGWSVSRVVREGIRLVEQLHTAPPRRKLIGIGEYDSRIADLATNRQHMEDFGGKSMGRSRRKPARGTAG